MTVRITTRWMNEVETTDSREEWSDTEAEQFTYQLNSHGQLVVSRHPIPDPGKGAADMWGNPIVVSIVVKVFGPTGFQSVEGDMYVYDHVGEANRQQFLNRVKGRVPEADYGMPNPFLDSEQDD